MKGAAPPKWCGAPLEAGPPTGPSLAPAGRRTLTLDSGALPSRRGIVRDAVGSLP